jgi:autotransporter-associated beta strand protein
LRIGQGQSTGALTIDGASARAWFSGTNNTIGGNDMAITSGTGTLNLRAGELAVNSLTTGTVAGSQGTFNFSGGTLRPYSQDTTIGGFTGFTIALAGTSATLSGIDAAAGTSRTLTILTTLVDGTAGAGGLNVAGGMVVLARTNSFTGNTTVSSGTLSIGNGSTAGSIPGNVANNGTLVFNRSNAITYSGTISGSGNVLQQGAGTLTLSGSNSFTGNTTVNSGTLLLSNSNALRGSTFTGGAGTLAFGGTETNGGNNYFYVGGLSGSSALSLTGTNGTAVRLNFGLNNADTTFSGNVTGTSVNQFVEKAGTGTTTISGTWTLGGAGLTGGAMTVIQGGIRQIGGVVENRRFDGSAGFAVGSGAGNSGTYVLESGTLMAVSALTSHLRIGQSQSTGALTIDGASARAWFSGTNNTIGGNDMAITSGTGTLNLRAGELAVNSLTTGTVAGSQGTFNFSGGTLRPYSQDTSIGQNGTGFTIALSGNSPTLSGLDAAAGTARNLTILTSLVNASGTAGGINVSGGTVTLSAANTYSGATTIAGTNATLRLSAAGSFANSSTIRVGSAGSSGAVLDLTSKTSGFTFGSGQTVGGIGTLNIGAGRTVTSNGIWAPGNSIGSNAVTGNLTLSGTSQFELGTPGASTTAPGLSDFTAVSGTLTLGGNLQLINNAGADGNGSVAGGVYRLFTYGNAVSGSYTSVTTNPTATTVTGLGDISYGGPGTAAGQGVFLTVYDRAVASFEPGSVPSTSLTLDFFTVNEGDTVSPLNFSLYNLLQTAGYTADLALIDIAASNPSGPFSTNLSPFSSLASGTFNSWQASVNTANQGTFSNTWTLQFKSANGGTAYSGDTTQTMTLTAQVIVVPEPGAIALAGIGIAAAAWGYRRRRS